MKITFTKFRINQFFILRSLDLLKSHILPSKAERSFVLLDGTFDDTDNDDDDCCAAGGNGGAGGHIFLIILLFLLLFLCFLYLIPWSVDPSRKKLKINKKKH